MRYVIGVLLITGGIIWDGVYYDGRYLDVVLKSVSSVIHSVTG